MSIMDLFTASVNEAWCEDICRGAVVLRQFASQDSAALFSAIESVIQQAPLRQMRTPGGGKMSVGMTACGDYGWISDTRGYRYAGLDPLTDLPWPPMPPALRGVGIQAAAEAGYAGFDPDVCLINCYEPGAKMGLHQDKDERDFSAPIVSVSLGIPATFQFGGMKRADKPVKIPLKHGDVVVWGGEARLRFHGVLTIRNAQHPLTGRRRFNLTFRKAR